MVPPGGASESMSARCPQPLPRTSAKVGEGQRKLTVGLTCDFTLTGGASRPECEARCEPGTALITQRSQVQILPPLQRLGPDQRKRWSGPSAVRGDSPDIPH